jgi:hypothetical protein
MASNPETRKKGRPRKYSDAERSRAVELMGDISRTIESIVTMTGIPAATLHRMVAESKGASN